MHARKLFVFASVFFLFCTIGNVSAITKEDIISPQEGTWSNAQPLIINYPASSEIYYSFSSEDPLASGFAYDGPVVIDDTGKVKLYITEIDSDGIRKDFFVEYTVEKSDGGRSGQEIFQFIKNISENPIIRLKAGNIFSIPKHLFYSLGSNSEPYLAGKNISVNTKNRIDTYVPCTVAIGKRKWRFFIHTIPGESISLPQKKVPFRITDWTKCSFTDNKYIYQLDDGLWNSPKNAIELERNSVHKMRLQSSAYEFGNPVDEYEIPIMPEIVSEKNEDGSLSFYIPENPLFSLEAASVSSFAGTIGKGISDRVIIDTFDGDCIEGTVTFNVYYDGIYQGQASKSFLVDKQPPAPPQIISSSSNSFVHEKVTLNFTSEPDSKIFYAVSKPLYSSTSFENSTREMFDEVPPGKYVAYNGKKITLQSSENKATFYKVNAYSVDSNENASTVSEYRIIIDEYNYFISQTGKKLNLLSTPSNRTRTQAPDGSYGNPFTSFSQAVKLINANQFSRLHVIGDLKIENESEPICSDCEITGSNARIILGQFDVLKVQNASVTISGCVIEKNIPETVTSQYLSDEQKSSVCKMFSVENGKLTIDDSEISALFSVRGEIVNASDSEVTVNSSGLTAQASNYCSLINARNSSLKFKESRLTVTAPTGVCLCVQDSAADMEKCSCYVIGHLSRVAEILKSKVNFTENSFDAVLDEKHISVEPVWKDVYSKVELEENTIHGFN